ncbi:hypothetical protein F5Y09DRAFT_286851 [Xylaria sp. FL1042]|nr:hypothetical protein F5Y09DRAFT_286851 [Xylaria sp. FL1042]
MTNATRQLACDCNRRFATDDALAQHRRDSPRHHQRSQGEMSAPNTSVPTLATEHPRNNAWSNLVAATETAPSIDIRPTTVSGQKQSMCQPQKKKKNGNKKGKKRQGNTSSGSRAYSPLRRYYNPLWELEYQIFGPDHTQCSPDCDWCGICAIREPY